jgi:hypothetical protein
MANRRKAAFTSGKIETGPSDISAAATERG